MHCSGLDAEELFWPLVLQSETFCIALKWVGLLWTVLSFTESLGDVMRLRVVDLPGTEGSPVSP